MDMNWDIIISVGIFVVGVVFFLIWQPTRVLLKEIIFHPFEDSLIKIVPKKDDTPVVTVPPKGRSWRPVEDRK